MKKVPHRRPRGAGGLEVVPDPRQGWYFTSYVGDRLAIDSSECAETVRMRRWDALKLISLPPLLHHLGMPRMLGSEYAIINTVLVRGRLTDNYWTWTGMRGHDYINVALAHETAIDRHHVARAMRQLREHGLIYIGKIYGKSPMVQLSERFHRFCFEAQWRELLYRTNTARVDKLTREHGWRWLLERIDEGFRNTELNPKNKETRQRVLLIPT